MCPHRYRYTWCTVNTNLTDLLEQSQPHRRLDQIFISTAEIKTHIYWPKRTWMRTGLSSQPLTGLMKTPLGMWCMLHASCSVEMFWCSELYVRLDSDIHMKSLLNHAVRHQWDSKILKLVCDVVKLCWCVLLYIYILTKWHPEVSMVNGITSWAESLHHYRWHLFFHSSRWHDI